MAFCNGGKWLGRIVELAGDELTMRQTAEAFTRAVSRNVVYVQVSWDDFERATCEEMTRMYRWFQDVGYEVDIASLRVEYPRLHNFETFLRESSWIRARQPATTMP
jgi:hypothetical protein